MGAINRLIALKWGFLGVMILLGVCLSLLSYFFVDIANVLAGFPVPTSQVDWAHLGSLLILGLFLTTLGRQMGQRQAWGAFAAGLIYCIFAIYLLVAVGLLLQDPQYWLPNQVDSLFIWIFFGVVILAALAMVLTWFFLRYSERRKYYAHAQAAIRNPLAKTTCPTCGLIAEIGQCPQCNIRSKEARLTIGSQRQERLIFTEEAPSFKIGRRTDHSEAHIIISDEDGEHWTRVSVMHAIIEYDFTQEEFIVKDLSTNGTYLNDEVDALPPQIPRFLQNGDRLRLANAVELVFEF